MCNKSPRSTQLSTPPGYWVPACLAGVMAVCVHWCRVAGVIPYGKWYSVAERWDSIISCTPPFYLFYLRCSHHGKAFVRVIRWMQNSSKRQDNAGLYLANMTYCMYKLMHNSCLYSVSHKYPRRVCPLSSNYWKPFTGTCYRCGGIFNQYSDHIIANLLLNVGLTVNKFGESAKYWRRFLYW